MPTPGVLTDEDIIDEAGRGQLIAENFDHASVQQACYELRAGEVYYDLSDNKRRYSLDLATDFVLLKPYQLVVVITKESLSIPDDVIGRVLMKGRLFSLGLQPVNTYADPGFSGRMGIVIFNSSPNYLRLSQGDRIAKIEFERLPKAVRSPYRGQHGYRTEIWPIPESMTVPLEEAQRDSRVGSVGEEMRRAFGDGVGGVVDRIFRYERLLLLSVSTYVGFAVLIIVYTEASNERLPTLFAFVLGLVTNLVSSLLIYLATTLRRRRAPR